jgi:ribosomal-protein-alanine N-acetyltransferase
VTELRTATIADLEAVAELEVEVFGMAAWSWDSVEGEFDALDESRHIMVAVDGAEVVGYASLMYVAELADLQRIAVRKDHRRQGLASELLQAVLDAAVARACQKTLLEVAADNQPALALYERFGFRRISTRKRYYAGKVDAVVLEKLMPDARSAARQNDVDG